VFRSAQHAFAGYHLWSRFGERAEMRQFITRASPEQRTLIGFPPPGDDYWNNDTLVGVAQRYPGMDTQPYRDAMNGNDNASCDT